VLLGQSQIQQCPRARLPRYRGLEQKPAMKLSKRKLESYRRAEVVAQASRAYMAAGGRATQEMADLWSGAILDWMTVTGKLKYDKPSRRGRHR
jgi:hypothetical protein